MQLAAVSVVYQGYIFFKILRWWGEGKSCWGQTILKQGRGGREKEKNGFKHIFKGYKLKKIRYVRPSAPVASTVVEEKNDGP